MQPDSSTSWRETDFEGWFERHSRLPGGERLLPVGRHHALRRMVDLIAIDGDGGIVILEVKNESSNRRAIGQALEYLSQYDHLDLEELAEDYAEAGRGDLRADVIHTFGHELATLSARRRVFIVAPNHDAYSAVCTEYLARHFPPIIEFQLLTTAPDGNGFRLNAFECRPFRRLGGLDRTFALNPRGRRLFYVIEPGPEPIVWNVGRWHEATATVSVGARPSLKRLRRYRSHLLPIEPPSQVDLTSTGTVWKHRSRSGREAVVIGQVNPQSLAVAESHIAFAEFRNGGLGTFRCRPATEFSQQWARVDTTARPWSDIVTLAQRKLAAKQAQGAQSGAGSTDV